MKIFSRAGVFLLSLPCALAYTPNPLDVLSIHNSLSNYAYLIDTQQFGLLSGIFAPNLVANFSIPGIPVANGINQVVKQLNASLFNQTTHHAISSQVVTVLSDTLATSLDYFTATYFGKDELLNQTITIYGRSNDLWTRNSTNGTFLLTQKNETDIGPPIGNLSIFAYLANASFT